MTPSSAPPGNRLRRSRPADRAGTAILEDAYLAQAYAAVYRRLGALIPDGVPGQVVEIGAGSALAARWIPGLICSDVTVAAGLDLVLDAARLPFPDGSLRALVLKDAFHHLPDVPAFLSEATRCLAVGGAIVMCEPYWGPLARLVYRMHPEPFRPRQTGWEFAADTPWDSNQALPWIVLRRDRAQLSQRWPDLRIEEVATLVGPSYLLSGGVFSRTPVPAGPLQALHSWEERQGSWLDPARLSILVRLVRTTG